MDWGSLQYDLQYWLVAMRSGFQLIKTTSNKWSRLAINGIDLQYIESTCNMLKRVAIYWVDFQYIETTCDILQWLAIFTTCNGMVLEVAKIDSDLQ